MPLVESRRYSCTFSSWRRLAPRCTRPLGLSCRNFLPAAFLDRTCIDDHTSRDCDVSASNASLLSHPGLAPDADRIGRACRRRAPALGKRAGREIETTRGTVRQALAQLT